MTELDTKVLEARQKAEQARKEALQAELAAMLEEGKELAAVAARSFVNAYAALLAKQANKSA